MSTFHVERVGTRLDSCGFQNQRKHRSVRLEVPKAPFPPTPCARAPAGSDHRGGTGIGSTIGWSFQHTRKLWHLGNELGNGGETDGIFPASTTMFQYLLVVPERFFSWMIGYLFDSKMTGHSVAVVKSLGLPNIFAKACANKRASFLLPNKAAGHRNRTETR